MKATLEFSLPEDRCEHQIAVRALDWALTVFDLDDYLRGKLNDDTGAAPDIVNAAFEEARGRLHELLCRRNLSLDDIE